MGEGDILRALAGYPFAHDLAREQLRALAGDAWLFQIQLLKNHLWCPSGGPRGSLGGRQGAGW
jgi:hypothetical protein